MAFPRRVPLSYSTADNSYALQEPVAPGRGAVSHATITVVEILTAAFRRISALQPGGRMDDDQVADGLLALRLCFDSLNGSVARLPERTVRYLIPRGKQRVSWGVGPYDINDLPPVVIRQLWRLDGDFRQPLRPMDSADIARLRTSNVGTTVGAASHYYHEKGRRIDWLEFDFGGSEIPPIDNSYLIQLDGNGRYTGTAGDFIQSAMLPVGGPWEVELRPEYVHNAFTVELTVGGQIHVVVFRRAQGNRFTAEGISSPLPRTLNLELFYGENRSHPVELMTMEDMVVLGGVIIPALSLPQGRADALSYPLQLPHGWTQFVLYDVLMHVIQGADDKLRDEAKQLRDNAWRIMLRTDNAPSSQMFFDDGLSEGDRGSWTDIDGLGQF